MKKYFLIVLSVFLVNPIVFAQTKESNVITRHAKETITPIELNHGEILKYHRDDGELLEIELISTSANILYTNRDKIPSTESGADRGNMYRARLLYEYNCKIKVNGLEMNMKRYVGSQESFFEPYVINGVRIWFIGVSDIFEENGGFLNTARSANGLPNKNARFVLQDMTKRICPDKIFPWFKNDSLKNENFIYKDNFIDIGRCFNGADCFMGAYLAGESHGALDIDMPLNSLMYAPFDLDTQENIRVEAKKNWTDGSQWRINTGHIIKKYVPDNVPVSGGSVYGLGARRGCWWHPHAHFGFQIYEEEILYEVDPWIIFWQLFEDNKKRDGVLRAMMEPLNNTKTGEKVYVSYKSDINQLNNDKQLQIYWTFGDKGWAKTENAEHIFTRSGIYPITLTVVDDKNSIASFTQHITVIGDPVNEPSLAISVPNEPSFLSRPINAMDVYGCSPKFAPHTLEFLARQSRPIPNERKVLITNSGTGKLNPVSVGINYCNNRQFEWITLEMNGSANNQLMTIGVNATGLSAGKYEAIINVYCDNALNSPQGFKVVLEIPQRPAHSKSVIIDDRDDEFYCTPYFWIGHRFHGWGWPELKNAEGYNNFYLINGQRPDDGEFARFTPDLEAGKYDVWLYEKTPYASGPPANNEPSRFKVKVVSAYIDTIVWMEPKKMDGFFPRPYESQTGWEWLEPQPTRKIGTFIFKEGTDGYVEILAEDSKGQVIVDAVRFLKMDE